MRALRDEDPADVQLSKKVKANFERIFDELSATKDGIILRGTRIVLPEALEDQAVRTAHEGHQGRTKTKSLLRTKVWFARLDT